MKTFVTTLVCALALGSTATFASDPTEDKKAKPIQIGVFTTKEAKIQMAVRKGQGEKAVITLRDAKQNILHEDVMSKKSEKYDARFDVSQLEEGEYTLEVTSGKDKIQKKVSIQSAKQEAVRNVKLNK
ncbi:MULTISPECIES: DUF3244 domain-containing protein [Runella]|jgi:hypothetical protein|uniref:Uncharacterized protein n=1 Tax=Runella defluvii TaxID=370973 RepID=A0A7W6EQL3_9BACT|nr:MULTISPECIES: hypothetical protein [Runella]MCA0230621.1 hypothetical protein [Bacteroidota bacterium]HAK78060.1 hypothetical protein [Runella sp.]AYQ33380.1 hypothetical protein DTQ70_14980 [Runella sp. SP2]MBB3838531.1 hypothetical protein [Runella defluvii]HAO48940.1 hypothetical protein [Runella sp.]